MRGLALPILFHFIFMQDKSKDSDYVRISKEMHTHFMKLEDQVHVLDNQLKALNEKLSTAQADLLAKDNLVNQHTKVAEEAVSGNFLKSLFITPMKQDVTPYPSILVYIFNRYKSNLIDSR